MVSLAAMGLGMAKGGRWSSEFREFSRLAFKGSRREAVGACFSNFLVVSLFVFFVCLLHLWELLRLRDCILGIAKWEC
jgi:hypothetical protein